MMNRLVHTLKAITCLAALFATPLLAQEFRGTIAGVVSDQQGSAVPGAKVSVTEANTGTKVSVTSNSAGEYNAPLLLPGEYQVAVEMQGFKSFVRKGVNLGSGERVVIEKINVPYQLQWGGYTSDVATRQHAAEQGFVVHVQAGMPLAERGAAEELAAVIGKVQLRWWPVPTARVF